jgi:hypothetical protein
LLLQRSGQLAGARLLGIEQPRVLDGDRRLVGEGLQEIDLFFREQPCLSAGDCDRPDRNALAQDGHAYCTAIPGDGSHITKPVLQIRFDIGDLRDAPLKYRASRHAFATGQRGIVAPVHFADISADAVMRDEMEQLAVESVDKAELRVTEPGRAFGDHIENGLDLAGRATDDVEHIAGCCLIFERLTQLMGARLHLFEQSCILDCDHRLVGESFEQRDLPFAERLLLNAAKADGANDDTFAHQGNLQQRAEIPLSRVGTALRKLFDLGLKISDMEGLPLQDRATRHRSTAKGEIFGDGNRAFMGGETKAVAFRTPDRAVVGVAQANG